jgi:hypothetical protein
MIKINLEEHREHFILNDEEDTKYNVHLKEKIKLKTISNDIKTEIFSRMIP